MPEGFSPFMHPQWDGFAKREKHWKFQSSSRVFQPRIPHGDDRSRRRYANARTVGRRQQGDKVRSRLRFQNLLTSRDAVAPQMGGRKMTCRTIAVANQKGGTAKTATALSLGVALARTGSRVLLVDADPQGDLTKSLGWRDPDSLETTLATHLSAAIAGSDDDPAAGMLRHREGVDLMPSNIELAAMEMAVFMAMTPSRLATSGLLLISWGRKRILSLKKSTSPRNFSSASGEGLSAVVEAKSTFPLRMRSSMES